MTSQINRDKYVDELRKQLKRLFILRKADIKPPDTEKLFSEGFIHGAMLLGAFTKTEIEQIIEDVNQEIFGNSLKERLDYYKNKPTDKVSLYDMPTYQRQLKKIKFE